MSKRFRLADFLTHDQQDVWPKYLVLQPRLLDKLELIGEALEQAGFSSRLHVMSGFRTPQYNAKGVGPKGGRAQDSQHMYGDAADVFVDADGNGVMDDLDGDGRTTIADAQVLEHCRAGRSGAPGPGGWARALPRHQCARPVRARGRARLPSPLVGSRTCSTL